MDSLTFEGVNYNLASYAGITEAAFIDKGLKEGKYKNFNEQERKKLLKEAHRLIKKTEKPFSETPDNN